MHEAAVPCPCCGLKLAVRLVPKPDGAPAPGRGANVMQMIDRDLSAAIYAAFSGEKKLSADWTVFVRLGTAGEQFYQGHIGGSRLDHEAWARAMPVVSSGISAALARHFAAARWTLLLHGAPDQDPIVQTGSLDAARAETSDA